jgi:hypothetical protein
VLRRPVETTAVIQTSHFKGVRTVFDPIETLGHAARAGDWSGRVFAAQGKRVKPSSRSTAPFEKGASLHDRPRAGYLCCRSILSYY